MNKEILLKNILVSEWMFFKSVKSIKGKEPCQKDMATFLNSRLSYWSIYNENILKSYLFDLELAKSQDRNLITEKYAYMMKETDYLYYKEIENFLPIVDSEKSSLVNSILNIHILWEEELVSSHSNLLDNSRNLYKNTLLPSILTYFRSELYTYSKQTLKLILEQYNNSYSLGINLVEENLKNLRK
ncbi:MAG: DUF4125 family protein [Peptoniphilus sp.]|uniref:DUF4125 family protein n=1 Tax=Peptoniphilus sp. TaxID=1971214 RepID=UPI002A74AA4B|nr:DUF4125 family protein [Peptoniphilus sp.]MDY2987877.1 DUF4125 family protein [Peptoniphilus sp.]